MHEWRSCEHYTHGDGVVGRTHVLRVSFHRTELLVERTGPVPKHGRLQDVSTAAVELEQSCVQLHGQVWGNAEEEKRHEGTLRICILMSEEERWFREEGRGRREEESVGEINQSKGDLGVPGLFMNFDSYRRKEKDDSSNPDRRVSKKRDGFHRVSSG